MKQLAGLFKFSFMAGVFPSVLKTAKVVPFFKKDWKLNYSAYLPVSLLSNIEKMLERLMYTRLYTFLNKNNIICNLQPSFRQQYSISHVLINITEYNKRFSWWKYRLWIFVDLKILLILYVDHQMLPTKLNHYRIREISYGSGFTAINSGVLQGSDLGPLLLLLFINDLSQAITFCKVHHFAHDTNLSSYLINSFEKLNKLGWLKASS